MKTIAIPNNEAAKIVVQKTLDAVKPPPDLTISEWADRYRVLSSEASSEYGAWNTSRAEYQRGIMDAISDDKIEEVVIMSCAQVGKT
jgi:phage terminase large subunit GpA-like protein